MLIICDLTHAGAITSFQLEASKNNWEKSIIQFFVDTTFTNIEKS